LVTTVADVNEELDIGDILLLEEADTDKFCYLGNVINAFASAVKQVRGKNFQNTHPF